jgi:hypothetical protein
LTLLFVSTLAAQQSYKEFEKGLNLSESQRSQVDGIKRKYIDEWRNLKNESMQKRLELRELDKDRPGLTERTDKLERELRDLESSRQRLFRNYQGEVSSILNDEQRGRYNQFCDSERKRPINPPRYRQSGPPPPHSANSPPGRGRNHGR